MPTREVVYAAGSPGYKAMVKDFTDMFTWDAIEEAPSAADVVYTDFKKNCGDDAYVALRVQQDNAHPPKVITIGHSGVSSFSDMGFGGTDAYKCIGYAYGNGFFALCGSSQPMPNNDVNRNLAGVSTCRNILTGESSWCSFTRTSVPSYSGREPCDYFLFSKDNQAAVLTDFCIVTSAKVGAAVSLHNPATGCVSDKVFALSAIPDPNIACITNVIFNGVRYVRLGTWLVPAE